MKYSGKIIKCKNCQKSYETFLPFVTPYPTSGGVSKTFIFFAKKLNIFVISRRNTRKNQYSFGECFENIISNVLGLDTLVSKF